MTMLNISVKNIGRYYGTCGWLKAGLQDDSLKIEEAYTTTINKKKELALWLTDNKNKTTICIASHAFSDDYNSKFQVVIDWGVYAKQIHLTPAATETLVNIGEIWCNKKNQDFENENKPIKKQELAISFK